MTADNLPPPGELTPIATRLRKGDEDWKPIAGAPIDVQEAKKLFDAGLIEMVQGRRDDVFVQYVIVRKIKAKPRGFFRPPPVFTHTRQTRGQV